MSETLEKVISSASGAGKAHTGAAAVAAQPKDALSGHMNHLSEAQSQALVEFKQVCEKEGLYTPATAQGLASHDDATLLYVLLSSVFCPGLCSHFYDAGDFCARASSRCSRHCSNSRTRKSGARRITSKNCTRNSKSSLMKRRAKWYVLSVLQLLSSLTLPLSEVSSMDRSSRPPRTSRLHLRDPRPQLQEHGRL